MIQCPRCGDLWPASFTHCPNQHPPVQNAKLGPGFRVPLYPTKRDLTDLAAVKRP